MKDAPAAPRGDDNLRDAWRSTSRDARPTDACPEPERILAAAEGTLDRRETAEIVDHTATCPSCAEAWRLGAQLVRENEPAAASREPTRTLMRPYLALAAAVLVGVLGVWVHRSRPPDGGGTLRGGVELRLPREEFLLHWPAGPEDAPYRLTLSTRERGPIAVYEQLADTRFVVPEGDLVDLADGAPIQWRVEQVESDGAVTWSEGGVVELRGEHDP